MTRTQIDSFLVAAETLNFSKAAVRLFNSQPAVSKQISQLEAKLGFQLFLRTRTGLVLTESGDLLYRHFKKYEQDLSAIIDEAKDIHNRKTVTIRVGCLGGWDLDHFYPRMNTHFSERRPNFKFKFTGFTFSEIAFALTRKQVDFIIAFTDNCADFPEIQKKPLTSVGGVLTLSVQHPLAKKPDLSFADFKNETFYTVNEQDWFKQKSTRIRSACMQHGFVPNIFNQPSFSAALIGMHSERGVMYVDDWLWIHSLPTCRSIKTDDRYEVCIGWDKDELTAEKEPFIDEMVLLFQE